MESRFLKRMFTGLIFSLMGYISFAATSPEWKSSIPTSTSSGTYFDLKQQVRWNYGTYTNPQNGTVCTDQFSSASWDFTVTITSVTGGASVGDITVSSDGKINFPEYPTDTYVKINYTVSVDIDYSYQEAVFPGFNNPGCAYSGRTGSKTLSRSGSIQRNYSTTNPVSGSSISYWDTFCDGDGINISVPSTSGATFRVRNSSTKSIVKSSSSTTLNIPPSDVSDLLLSGSTYGFIVSRRVSYTYESTSSASSYAVTSTRYSNPTYTRIDGEKSVCEGDLNQTYTVIGSNFDDSDWSCSSCTVNSTTSNSANVTWNNNSSTKQIRVTLSRTTDSGDCTTIEYSDNVNFNFFTDYTVSGTSNVCFGDKGTINLSGSINGRTYELWDSGGRIASQDKTGTGSSLSWSGLDGDETYTVYLNSGTCGRYSQGSKTINEYSQKSKPSISGTNEICSGSTLVLNGSTGNSTNSWEWFADYGSGYSPVTGQTTSTLSLSNTSNLVRVRARYYDSNNCPSAYSDGRSIEVVDPAIPTITGVSDICVGDYSQSYTTNIATDGYLWSVTGGTISGGNTSRTVNINWTPGASSAKVSLISTTNSSNDIASCDTDLIDFPVVIRTNINFYSLSGTQNVCNGELGSVTLSDSDNGLSYVLYIDGARSVVGSDAKTGTGSSLTWNNLTPGKTYSVYMETVDCGNFKMGSDISINEYSLSAKPTVTTLKEVCSGQATYNFTFTGPSNLQEFIVYDDSGSELGRASATSGSGTYALPVTSSDVDFEVSYIDVNGCESVHELFTVEYVTPPTPNITGENDICINDYSQTYDAGVTADGYLWSVSGGTIIGGNTSRTLNVNWTPGATNANVAVVTSEQSISGSTTCNSEEQIFDVSVRNNINFYSLSGTENVCYNESGSITLSDSDIGSTYVLYVNGARSSVGSHAKSGTGSAIDWENLSTGETYAVYLETVDCGNYKMGTDIYVNEYSLSPKPTVTTLKEVCSGQATYNFTFTGPSNLQEFIVYDDSGSELGRASATSGSGTYALPVTSSDVDFEVSFIDGNGCESESENFRVEYVTPPVPTISGAFEICQGQENSNVYDAGIVADSYIWTVVGGSITGSSNERTVSVNWTPGSTNSSISVRTRKESVSGAITCNSSIVTEPVTIRSGINFFTVSGTSNVCKGEKGTIELGGSVIGEVYSLYVNGTKQSPKSGVGSSLEWTNLDPGNTYEVYLETASCGNYLMDDAITITEYPVSTKPSVITLKEVCGAGTYNFVFEGQSGLEEFYLYNSSGTLIGTYPSTDDQATALLTVNNTSNSFRVSYLDANGCISAQTSFSIEIVESSPSPGIVGETEICQDAENGNVYDANIEADSYLWSVNEGTIIGPSTQKTVTVNWTPGATNASIEVIATYESSTGTLDCDSEPTSLDVDVLANISYYDFNQSEYICEESTGSATLSDSQVGKIYVLYKDGVRSDAAVDAKIGTGSALTWNNLEAFETYTINLEDPECGNYEMNGSVFIQPSFSSNPSGRANNTEVELQTTPSGNVESGEPVIFEISLDADSYYWEFTGDLSSKESRPVMVFNLPDTTIEVDVTLSYETGCDVSYNFKDVIEITDSQGRFSVNNGGETFELEVSINGTSYELYPNPAVTESNFSFKSVANETVSITVSDLKQSVVNKYEFDVSNNPLEKTILTIPLDGLTPGLYVTKIEGRQFERPIIIVGIKK
ncbi:hypothetical protein AAOE16_18210 [Ekhidna sp. MALMAid0563]|uniref:hypothetical protein n=1 Tax=Ekhidna sp. MALMAid0563 TaxID=3143937 RepID=UPI0032DE85E3